MQTIFNLLIVFAAVGICALHVLSVTVKEKLARVFAFINIGLHIALVFLLLLRGARLELLVLIFMLSLLFYVTVSSIVYKLSARRSREEEDGK